MTKKQKEGIEACENLKELLTHKNFKGLMFDVVHVAKSGMSRVISVKLLMKNTQRNYFLLYPNYLVAKATDHQHITKGMEGVKYNGCGFDATYSLALDISRCVGLSYDDLKIIK